MIGHELVRYVGALSTAFLLVFSAHSHARCPETQVQISEDLAQQAAETSDEIDRLLLLKRSVKVCSAYPTWLALGQVEMQLENYMDAVYAFEHAVEFHRMGAGEAMSSDQLQRQAIASAWLAEAYLADNDIARALLASEEAIGAFEVLGLPVPERLLETQAKLDDSMGSAGADVMVRSIQLQQDRQTRGIGVRPVIRQQVEPPETAQETAALVADYSGEQVAEAAVTVADPIQPTESTSITSAVTEDSTVPVSEARLNIPVLFNFDSASLSEESLLTIEQLGEALTALELESSAIVMLIGHTDARGNAAYNAALSQRRAESVADVLASQWAQRSLPALNLQAQGRGETELRYVGRQPDDHRRNRRVEVIVLR